MKLFPRTSLILAAILLVLPALGIESAPSAEDKTKEKAAEPWSPAIDTGAARQLQEAADHIQNEDWKSVLRSLQQLLDSKANALARLADHDGKPDRYVIVHTECERLLASLPDAGRKEYQRVYGPRAADLLDEARQNNDAERFAHIVERYLYTDAGPSALRELARLHYKARQFHLAALAYARLLEHVGPARWADDDLYQAAIVFHHRGMFAQTEGIQKQLLTRIGQNFIRLGKRKLTVEELRKEIESMAPATKPLEWPIYRGDVARTNRGAGGPFVLQARWRQSMLSETSYEKGSKSVVKELLHQTEKQLQKKQEPIIPAFSPITLTVLDQKGDKKPLLFYKNYLGVTAVDLRNGNLAWASPAGWSLQRMLGSGLSRRRATMDWLNDYEKEHPQILFENSSIGTLSSDGQFVYAVDDLAVPPRFARMRPDSKKGIQIRTVPNPYIYRESWSDDVPYDYETVDAILHNHLYAFSLAASGKATWVLGEDDKAPLHDYYFLGPPLPLDDLLYMLIQKNRQVFLLCIDPKAGEQRFPQPKIVFRKPLVEVATPLIEDPIRRALAAHLAYGEGVLVCPTNAGVLFGFDLLLNRLAWVYLYLPKAEKNQDQPNAVAPSHNLWKVSAPVIADGKVVFTPPDDPSIYCLNLSNGSLLWSRKKGQDDMYLAGVYDGKVLIVGAKSIRALNLSNGETMWTQETGLPSGQGIAVGDTYYLPLQYSTQSKQPEILVLDINKGRVIARNKLQRRKPHSDDFDVPGNLVFVEGTLISQTPWEIIAYPPRREK